MAGEKKNEIAQLLLKNDMNQAAVVAMGYNKGTVSKAAKALKNGWRPEAQQVKQTGGSLATVTERKPAAIVFSLGDVDIPLNPKYLYDTYLYYQDIQRMDPTIDDEFSLGIRAAMKHIWEDFSHRKVEKAGATIKEVLNGGRVEA